MSAADAVAREGFPSAMAEAGSDTRGASIDEAAFRAVYHATARPLWAYLYRTLGSAADADDALQDVFLRFLRSPRVTGDEGAVRALLFRIASNLAIDHWRRRQREGARMSGEELPSDAPAARDGGPSVDSIALRRDMASTFRQLKPRERVLLWLAYVEGSGHAQIAQSLGVERASVAVMLFRARKRLASLLKRKGWEN